MKNLKVVKFFDSPFGFILLALGVSAVAWFFFYETQENAWILMLFIINCGLLRDNSNLRKKVKSQQVFLDSGY